MYGPTPGGVRDGVRGAPGARPPLTPTYKSRFVSVATRGTVNCECGRVPYTNIHAYGLPMADVRCGDIIYINKTTKAKARSPPPLPLSPGAFRFSLVSLQCTLYIGNTQYIGDSPTELVGSSNGLTGAGGVRGGIIRYLNLCVLGSNANAVMCVVAWRAGVWLVAAAALILSCFIIEHLARQAWRGIWGSEKSKSCVELPIRGMSLVERPAS